MHEEISFILRIHVRNYKLENENGILQYKLEQMDPFKNYNPIQALVFLGLLALGASQSMMTCEECTRLARSLGEVSTSEAALEFQLAVIVPLVCPGAPDPAQCEADLPTFWGAISTNLFTMEAWWNPEFFCAVEYLYKAYTYFTNNVHMPV